MTIKLGLAFIHLIFGVQAAHGRDFDSEGVRVELSVGRPTVEIENPDTTKAGYAGLSAMGKGFLSMWGGDSFRLDFTGSMKYLDLENTASGDQKENAQYLGPGMGLQFSYSRLFVGVDYYFLRGRHSAVGQFSNQTEFTISGMDYHAGFRMHFGTGSLGFAYSHMTSSVRAADTGLSKDAPWSDQVYWLQFGYSFKTTAGGLFESIIGN